MSGVFVSYAQNFEDVLLWRALGHVDAGYYIDIGAQDPVIDSVSLAFHERGWTGLHVEPTLHYAMLLRAQRPGDTVLQAAIGDPAGLLPLFEFPNTGLSTLDKTVADKAAADGFPMLESVVPVLLLAAVFEARPERDIHWMKVDVEGFELQVLQGWGECQARPWVVVVESTWPRSQKPTHAAWEPLLIDRGYSFVQFDGLNRYYVSAEHPELRDAFTAPANVFDMFAVNGTASNHLHTAIKLRHELQLASVVKRIDDDATTFAAELQTLKDAHTLAVVEAETRFIYEREKLLEAERSLGEQLARSQQRIDDNATTSAAELQTLKDAHTLAVAEAETRFIRERDKLLEVERSLGEQLARLQQQKTDEVAEAVRSSNAVRATLEQALAQADERERDMRSAREDADCESSRQQSELRKKIEEAHESLLRLSRDRASRELEVSNQFEVLRRDTARELATLEREHRDRADAWHRAHAEQRSASDAAQTERERFIIEQARVCEDLLRQELAQARTNAQQIGEELGALEQSWTRRLTRSFSSSKRRAGLNPPPDASTVFQVAPIPSIPSDGATSMTPDRNAPRAVSSVEDLLNLHDSAFVHAAYLAVLRRHADPTGLFNLLDQVRRGAEKEQIVAALAMSTEGQAVDPATALPGLAALIERARRDRASLPIRALRRLAMTALRPLSNQLVSTDARLRELAELTEARLDRVEALLVVLNKSVGGTIVQTTAQRKELERLSPHGRNIFFELKEAASHQSRISPS